MSWATPPLPFPKFEITDRKKEVPCKFSFSRTLTCTYPVTYQAPCNKCLTPQGTIIQVFEVANQNKKWDIEKFLIHGTYTKSSRDFSRCNTTTLQIVAMGNERTCKNHNRNIWQTHRWNILDSLDLSLKLCHLRRSLQRSMHIHTYS